MSAQKLILQHREGACLTVTINRPEKANSLTRDMLIQLRDVFLAAQQDDSLHAVILTGDVCLARAVLSCACQTAQQTHTCCKL